MKSTIIKNGDSYTMTCVANGTVISGKITEETAKRTDLKELTIEEVKRLFIDKDRSIEAVDYSEFIQRLKDWNHPYLEYVNSRIQYKGIPLAIPEALCKRMAFATYDELEALCNFWRNLALCPEPRVREGLFEYLEHNGFIITKQGLIVSLRRVHNANKAEDESDLDQEYVDLVTNSYWRIKKAKRGLRNYAVVYDDAAEQYALVHADQALKLYSVLDTLAEQYQELQENSRSKTIENSNYYVANHSSQVYYMVDGESTYGRVKYYLLRETRLNRNFCDHDPTQHCSTGLHLGTPDYVRNNSWLGDTILVCLSNPMDAVSVPEDGYMKFRTAALYPIAVITEDDIDSFTTDSENQTEVLDEDYLNYTTEYIEAQMQSATFESLKEDFIIPREFKKADVTSILADIKSILAARVK